MDETFHSSSLVIPYLDTHSMSVKQLRRLIIIFPSVLFSMPLYSKTYIKSNLQSLFFNIKFNKKIKI